MCAFHAGNTVLFTFLPRPGRVEDGGDGAGALGFLCAHWPLPSLLRYSSMVVLAARRMVQGVRGEELEVKIVKAKAFLCDVEVETVRTDAIQSFAKQETIFRSEEHTSDLQSRQYLVCR